MTQLSIAEQTSNVLTSIAANQEKVNQAIMDLAQMNVKIVVSQIAILRWIEDYTAELDAKYPGAGKFEQNVFLEKYLKEAEANLKESYAQSNTPTDEVEPPTISGLDI